MLFLQLFALWLILFPAPDNEVGIMIQISITVSSAYLSFFVAEHVCEVSGVLAVCGSALVGAAYAHPLFHSGETMENVWGFIELVGNTMIFMLAGLPSAIPAAMTAAFDAHLTASSFVFILRLSPRPRDW
jgi:NhaP-type Na+/H+ or K+/H+ antiporter